MKDLKIWTVKTVRIPWERPIRVYYKTRWVITFLVWDRFIIFRFRVVPRGKWW